MYLELKRKEKNIVAALNALIRCTAKQEWIIIRISWPFSVKNRSAG